jgi:3-oxoacyl-[acyl-carrier-protein] synthase III
MLLSHHDKIKVAGLSVAVPSGRIAVEHYYSAFGQETVDKFSEMAGVKEVTRAIPQQTAADLGYEAAVNLIKTKGIDKDDIGLIMFVSQKPDYRSPASAYVLQKRLGLSESILCFDVNLACSGFVYGLQTCMSLLSASNKKLALLVTSDTSHKTISPEDRTMIMLFGDSGSALLLEKDDACMEEAVFGLRTNGAKFKSIVTPAGAFRNMDLPNIDEQWTDDIVRSDYNTHMKGMDVFGFSITDVPKLMKDFLAETNTPPEDYDVFALHQANLYILKQLSRKVKIPFGKIPVSIDRFGNNSSNSIPLVLSDHFGAAQGKLLKVFICGFGAGLSWACGSIHMDESSILPIFETDEYYKEGFI